MSKFVKFQQIDSYGRNVPICINLESISKIYGNHLYVVGDNNNPIWIEKENIDMYIMPFIDSNIADKESDI